MWKNRVSQGVCRQESRPMPWASDILPGPWQQVGAFPGQVNQDLVNRMKIPSAAFTPQAQI